MSSVIALTIGIIALFLVLAFIMSNREIISFFTTGMDNGFKISEIMLLHKIATEASMEEPAALYWSIPALNQSISTILRDARKNGTENSQRIQDFLGKMYKYRTRVELDPRNSHTLKTTRGLAPGQKIRVVLRGRGVFSSQVINAGRELVITLPVQKDRPLVPGSDWIHKVVTVYLNRPRDASYVFDTEVHNAITVNGRTSLFLGHTDNLLRTQKRKSVRCNCQIFAQLYLVNPDMTRTAVETAPGLKCLIEDLSEDGAMIRIGGAGRKDINIKVQFPLDDKMVVMFGVVRAVEYNQNTNQSRLHFEYIDPDPVVKNSILTYVYKIIPEEQKEAIVALEQAEKDMEMEAAEANGSSEYVQADKPVEPKPEPDSDFDYSMDAPDDDDSIEEESEDEEPM